MTESTPEVVPASTMRPLRRDYRRLFGNRAWLLLWSGQNLSIAGDQFFNIAVFWVVYSHTGSALQTALINAVWQLAPILFGPLAGAFADRHDRKLIMVVTNLLAAAVVAGLSGLIFADGIPGVAIVLLFVFILNGFTEFYVPARSAIMPAVVGRGLLATAAGLAAMAANVAELAGSALAGLVLAAAGAAWAVGIDSVSFVLSALAVVLAPIGAARWADRPAQRHPLLADVRTGFQFVASNDLVRGLVLLALLVNLVAVGPVIPALVDLRLHAGPAAYGVLSAASVAGGITGGLLTGPVERRLGAGSVILGGFAAAGVCMLAVAASTSLLATSSLFAVLALALTGAQVSYGAVLQGLVPDEYRGRVAGTSRAIAVLSIPPATLGAGWAADVFGPAPVFAAAGVWTLAVIAFAALNPHIRSARL